MAIYTALILEFHRNGDEDESIFGISIHLLEGEQTSNVHTQINAMLSRMKCWIILWPAVIYSMTNVGGQKARAILDLSGRSFNEDIICLAYFPN